MTKERRLGRGLEALLGSLPNGYGEEPAPNTQATAEPTAGALLQLHVHDLEPNPFQPRREFDPTELAALAESLRQHGLLQPVAVRRVGERYQLVAGERRWRAAIAAGWETVPAQLVEADDRQATELAIVENLQRTDLNALEKAGSFQQYLERYQCTQEELARRLQLDRSTVANLIRLLELPATVQQALRNGAITAGHARALLPLGDEREQVALCQQIQAEGLSVRAVESYVQETLHAADADEEGDSATIPVGTKPIAKRPGQLSNLEQELRSALGTKVEIRHGARGKGKIIVHFANHDEFERLLEGMTADLSAARSRAG